MNIMNWVSRILLALVGLLFVSISAGFLLTTQSSAADVGLNISSLAGYATVRADMSAYFIVSGGILLYASARKAAHLLWPVLLLIIAAYMGRLITVFVDGYEVASFTPMIVEAIIVGLIIYAQKFWHVNNH